MNETLKDFFFTSEVKLGAQVNLARERYQRIKATQDTFYYCNIFTQKEWSLRLQEAKQTYDDTLRDLRLLRGLATSCGFQVINLCPSCPQILPIEVHDQPIESPGQLQPLRR